MRESSTSAERSSLSAGLLAFVADRYPFALPVVQQALASLRERAATDDAGPQRLRPRLGERCRTG